MSWLLSHKDADSISELECRNAGLKGLTVFPHRLLNTLFSRQCSTPCLECFNQSKTNSRSARSWLQQGWVWSETRISLLLQLDEFFFYAWMSCTALKELVLDHCSIGTGENTKRILESTYTAHAACANLSQIFKIGRMV